MQFNIRDSNVFCAKYLVFHVCNATFPPYTIFFYIIYFIKYIFNNLIYLILLYADGTPLDVYLAQDFIKLYAYLLVYFNMANLRHVIIIICEQHLNLDQ